MLQLYGPWLHVSAALGPSSGQLVQIQCPQCAYNTGSHSVYSHDMCEIKKPLLKNVFWKVKYVTTLIQSHLNIKYEFTFILNPLNAELNPICHLLALLGGATIVVVSRLRVNI